jgi:hypothetical protein
VEIASSANRQIDNYISTPIEVFPNPAGETLHIRFPHGNLSKTVRIMNMAGQVIGTWDVADTQLTLPVRNWSQGLYIIQYTLDGQAGFTRFIKE